MALNFPPKVGEVFECEFPSCLKAPEMHKKRLVIVVGPRLIQRDQRLVNVVPISLTPPPPGCQFHAQIPLSFIPGSWAADTSDRWAKCDMIYTLSIERLTVHSTPGLHGAARISHRPKLDLTTLQAVRRCVAIAMGISREILP